MGRDLLDALLEGQPTLLHELFVEATERVLVWGWGNDDAGVVHRQRFVQPEEDGVPSQHGDCGLREEWGVGLCDYFECRARGMKIETYLRVHGVHGV